MDHGVKTIDKSNAWLENKCPDENHKFGVMVYFYIVTENSNQQCKGNDLLNKMEKIFKIEIPTIGRASSIASFKKPLHKYFVTSSYIDFTPIGDSVLYFNMIKTWEEWDVKHKGNRDKILKELEIFRKSYMRFIHQELSLDSNVYMVMVLSLAKSIAWVEVLLKFVDYTHEERMRSKFSCKKSWAVATRFVTSLIERISQPQKMCIQYIFLPGNNLQVAQTIFFCVLQCLDLMVENRAQGLHNADCVQKELLTFLALNTEHEAIEKLKKDVVELKMENKFLKEKIESVNKTAMAGLNKAANNTKTLAAMKKRLKKLE